MTLDELYELVIHQVIYGILRLDPVTLTISDYKCFYYGITNNGISTIVLECHDTYYVIKTPEFNMLICMYDS